MAGKIQSWSEEINTHPSLQITKKARNWLLVGLLPLLCGWMLALDPRLAITQYVHNSWDMDSGLFSDTLRAITQTADGYIWIGTADGLIRFDGLVFTRFTHLSHPGIKSNYINALHAGNGAYLWIATTEGLTSFDGRQFRTFTTQDGLLNRDILSLYGEGDCLWVGTGKGLSRIIQGRIQSFPNLDQEGPRVNALNRDGAGRILAGTVYGLYVLDQDRLRPLTWPGLIPSVEIKSICRDSAGVVWLGTAKGLFKISAGQAQWVKIKEGPESDYILCLNGDQTGCLWIGMQWGGLARISNGEIQRYTTHDGLSHDVVTGVLIDRENNLWATTSFGLNRFYQGKAITWTSREGLLGDKALVVYEDHQEQLWIGTREGLSSFHNGRFTHLIFPKNIESRALRQGKQDVKQGQPVYPLKVRSICQGRDQSVWIGLENGGLVRWRNGEKASYSTQHGLSHHGIMALFEDSSGNLWVGTKAGLDRFHRGVISVSTRTEYLPQIDTRFIHQRRDGSIWVCTNGQGLYRLQNDMITRLILSESLMRDKLMTICEDQDGILWIGTWGRGIIRLKDGKITSYNTDNGLLDNVAYQILDDRMGNLWVSGNKGIYRVSRQDLNDFAEGKTLEIHCYTFGTAEGMKKRECNGFSQPAGCRTSNGHLWFPTTEGVVEIDPKNLNLNQQPPPVVIEGVFADGRRQTQPGGRMELPAGTKDVVFHFVGLSYVNPNKVHYRYRLEGYNPNPVEAGISRVASYTNLPPGDYYFQVTACNNDGKENPAWVTVAFHIQTPFWATWWFLTAEAVLGVCVLNLVITWGRKLVVSLRFWRRAHFAGPYRIVDTIGKGGMGTVYRARDTRDGRTVALKIFHEDVTDEEVRRRFSQECEICENIRHPNMVRIFEHGTTDNRLYFAMELCEGRTLREFMLSGPVGADTAVMVVSALFETVHDIHQLGVIHRDIKPENILFRDWYDLTALPSQTGLKEKMVLLDFGLARLIDSRTRTRTGLITGTVDYLSPEYLHGLRTNDTALDFYSIGIIFYELLTGRTPYWEGGDDMMQRIYAIVYSDPVPPSTLKPVIPQSLSTLVMELIEKDYARRLIDYESIISRLKQLG